MAKGGKRKGAGRPKGKSDQSIREIREILNSYTEPLLNKAFEMAMDGNASVLNKLLDKLLPNLNAVDLSENNIRPREVRITFIDDETDQPTKKDNL